MVTGPGRTSSALGTVLASCAACRPGRGQRMPIAPPTAPSSHRLKHATRGRIHHQPGTAHGMHATARHGRLDCRGQPPRLASCARGEILLSAVALGAIIHRRAQKTADIGAGMTTVARSFGSPRPLVICLAWVFAPMLGCTGQVRTPSEHVARPRVVVVAPVLNLSGSRDFDPLVITDLVASGCSDQPSGGWRG